MFSKEELIEKKKFEVQSIAKDLGIPRYRGKSEIKKDELIENILEAQNGKGTQEDTTVSDKETESVEQPVEKKQNKIIAEVQKLNEKKEKKFLTEEERAENKRKYVENAQVGTLVAFKTDTGRVKSAMIKKRSTSKRRFLLETKYGAKYKVPFEDVLWVRTNKRWPKGIFQLLRGENVETTEGE